MGHSTVGKEDKIIDLNVISTNNGVFVFNRVDKSVVYISKVGMVGEG